jgi:hypothetical protein
MLGSYWFLISFNRNSVADYKELMRAGYDQWICMCVRACAWVRLFL